MSEPKMRVIQIIKSHLVANGFDGLVQVDSECGCLVDDLVPCCDDFRQCEPGYRGVDINSEGGDWAIYRSKALAIESVQKVKEQSCPSTPNK